jgi:hypothetical protein
MQLKETTHTLLTELDALSGRRLSRREDLGSLIELAEESDQRPALEELSFYGKFVSRSYRIMQRIGRDGEGYDRLNSEFMNALERCRSLIRAISRTAPPAARDRLENIYLQLAPSSLEALIALADDLSTYKNWLLDRRRQEP